MLADPVIHRRTITLDKGICGLTVVDRFRAKSTPYAKLYFHVHPACEVSQVSSTEAAITIGEVTLLLSPTCGQLTLRRAKESEQLGWISESYHSKRPSTCIVVDAPIDGETETTTYVYFR